MAARKMHGKQMQYKESNDAKIGGDKEGHLGFGGVNGTNRIFTLLDKGERVNACKVGDRGQVCGRRNVVDGGGVTIGSFHAEKPARPTTNEVIIPRGTHADIV